MFIGEYQHNLDNKGRIIIPSKFRDELHDSFYLTKGYDGCLTIYSAEQWEKVLHRLSKLPSTKTNARKYLHVLTARASECVPDKMGRINIPDYLASDAGLNRECVVVGVNDHVEIWDKDRWNAYYAEASANFEEIAEGLEEIPDDE